MTELTGSAAYSFEETEKIIIANSKQMATICYKPSQDNVDRDSKRDQILKAYPSAKYIRFWEDFGALCTGKIGRIDLSDEPLLLPEGDGPWWTEELNKHQKVVS